MKRGDTILVVIFHAVALNATLCLTTIGCNSKTKTKTNEQAETSQAGEAAKSNSQSASHGKPEDERVGLTWVDITKSLDVNFAYRNGGESNQYTILESLGGGIGLIDYDRDGYLDIFCPGGGGFQEQQTTGLPAELFRSLSGERMVKVAAQAGQGFLARCYTHGAFVADYDCDGFSDVLVTGYGGLHLWRNHGDGTFEECHELVGLVDDRWSSAAAWADFNRDGLLDLYVAHYVDWSFEKHPFCRGRTQAERDICPPREFNGLPDNLYLGQSDGSFVDVSKEWNLRGDGKGLGVLVADFDNNGFVDVYVANDTVNNFLYSNQGTAPFRESAMLSGVAADKAGVPNGSMGVDLCDFDHSGRADIWVTNYEREDFALYRNEGPGAFLHVSDVAGLNVLGGLFVGFGTVCCDLDLDGNEDILVNNGHVILYPTASPRAQTPLMLKGDKRRFRRAKLAADSYLMQPHEGRGLAVGDLDNDGDFDAVYSNINASIAIQRNDLDTPAAWLQIQLVGIQSNRDAIGAVATVQLGSETLMRIRKGGGSYMSTSDSRLSFGLGAAKTIDRLTIRWPSGKEQVLEQVAVNQVLRLTEPAR